MPTLHVCPLSRLHETVASTRARHVVSLIGRTAVVERPAAIEVGRHLLLGMSDIVDPLDGHVLPGPEHVESLLGFVRGWEREAPLVIHCWAGISRSTAGAYIAACALLPDRSETELALRLREASRTATPNRRLVTLADEILGRRGRMIAAIERIGRGADAAEGEPFTLRLV